MFENESKQTDNEKMLDEVVQNTEMGKNVLAEIMTLTDDVTLKNEALRQQRRYRQINQQAHTALAAIGARAKGQSAMAKMNVSMGIRTRTMRDKSTRNLAGLLAQGSARGIQDCIRARSEYPRASAGALSLLDQLQQLQQESSESWQRFM